MDARKIFIFGTLVLLLGCSTKKEIQYVDRVVTVEVPVMQQVEFERPTKPIYYIKSLKSTSTPKEIAEAYVNTIKQLNVYIQKLETLTEPFYKK